MKKLTDSTTEELVRRYQEASQAYGKFSDLNDNKRANPKGKLVYDIFQELSRRGKNDLSQLQPLLNDNDAFVRLHSASHLLSAIPEVAIPVLEEILADDHPFRKSSARLALNRWKNGEVRRAQ